MDELKEPNQSRTYSLLWPNERVLQRRGRYMQSIMGMIESFISIDGLLMIEKSTFLKGL